MGKYAGDIEALLLLLWPTHLTKHLLNEKNPYRYFKKEKEWEDLQREYPGC
jgi:hypothetical protein